jgi:hypothetical protein
MAVAKVRFQDWLQHDLDGGLNHSAVTGWTVYRFMERATVEPFRPSNISLTISWPIGPLRRLPVKSKQRS